MAVLRSQKETFTAHVTLYTFLSRTDLVDVYPDRDYLILLLGCLRDASHVCRISRITCTDIVYRATCTDTVHRATCTDVVYKTTMNNYHQQDEKSCDAVPAKASDLWC